MNPLWQMQQNIPILPQQMIPQPVVPQQTPPPQQMTQSYEWNWKTVADYNTMLREPIPLDGTPILFMMENESVFYIVHMNNGRKMINGYAFNPLESLAANPVDPTEQRFAKLEEGLSVIANQLNRLVGVQNESNSENVQQITRQAIK